MKNTRNTEIDAILKHHPALTHAAEMAEICAPLAKLEITYFSHVHINHQHRFTAINNSPAFTEIYLKNHYFNFDYHHEEIPDGEQYILWDTVPLAAETQSLEDDFNACQFAHTFSILSDSPTGRDCYHFATRPDNVSMNGKYLHMLSSLKQFINYFKDKVLSDPALVKAYDLGVSQQAGIFQKAQPTLNIDQFNHLIQSKRFYSMCGQQHLTSREVECLYWMSQGKTYDETAIILGISARTVKAHVEAIKLKTNSQNLFQLGVIFSDILSGIQKTT